MGQQFDIPITKAKATVHIDMSTEPWASMPEILADQIWYEGLKVIANSTGMASIKIANLKDEELKEAQEKALEQGQKNLKAFLAGERASRGGKAKVEKEDRKVTAEAKRLAVIGAKDWLRANGHIPSHFKSPELNKIAASLLEADPGYVELAKANIAAQKAKTEAAMNEASVKILKGLKPDEAKLKAAAERKAKVAAEKQLSAAKAAKPEVRKRKAPLAAPIPKGAPKVVVAPPPA